MASSALASEAVCLNAVRILAGRDRGDERQNHNDDPGHRCRPFLVLLPAAGHLADSSRVPKAPEPDIQRRDRRTTMNAPRFLRAALGLPKR